MHGTIGALFHDRKRPKVSSAQTEFGLSRTEMWLFLLGCPPTNVTLDSDAEGGDYLAES